jgi:hypothetical protein
VDCFVWQDGQKFREIHMLLQVSCFFFERSLLLFICSCIHIDDNFNFCNPFQLSVKAIRVNKMENEDFIWTRPLLRKHGPSHFVFFCKMWPILSTDFYKVLMK